MKKKLLSIVLLGMAVTSFGQITVTNNDIAQAGTTVYLASDTTLNTGIVPGEPGANKIWDFTNVAANTIDTINFTLPSLTPYADHFPNANFAFSSSDFSFNNVYAYMIRNDDKFSSIGYAIESPDYGTFFTHVVPENIILDFPVNYNNNYSETYTTDMVIVSPLPGVDSIRTKSIIIKQTTIDAWGSLTIPLGTYNTLRQRVDEDQTDSTFMKMAGQWIFLDALEVSAATYSWWTDDVNIGFELFSIGVDVATGEVSDISFYNGSAVGVAEINMVTTKVFPNPTSSLLSFDFDKSITGELLLYNQLGQVVVKEYLNSQKYTQINVSQLQPGIYIYRTTDNAGKLLSSGKVQKK